MYDDICSKIWLIYTIYKIHIQPQQKCFMCMEEEKQGNRF
jgi:hypothetical protein